MTRRSRLRLSLAVPVLAAALALSGCTSSHSSGHSAAPSALNDQTSAGPYQGIGLTPPQPRPSFTLHDLAGKSFAFGQQTAGHPTLLYFGYTNCPDVCPTTMFDIHKAISGLPKAMQAQVDVVFVSTDVKRDTAKVMKQWLANFSVGTSADFIGLRGTQTEIDAAQASAHVFLAEDDGQTHWPGCSARRCR